MLAATRVVIMIYNIVAQSKSSCIHARAPDRERQANRDRNKGTDKQWETEGGGGGGGGEGRVPNVTESGEKKETRQSHRQRETIGDRGIDTDADADRLGDRDRQRPTEASRCKVCKECLLGDCLAF